MKPEQWLKIETIFNAAVNLTQVERTALLDRLCGGDPSLRHEVESLLARADRPEESFQRTLRDATENVFSKSPEELVGQTVGHYRVMSHAGSGGMGDVFRAFDTKLARIIALKVLPHAFLDDQDRLARFKREAHALASLNHPHIAQIYGVEESSTTRCIVMEFVDGHTLADAVKNGPLSVEEALRYANQIADALEQAHSKGIIHRDLKPANIKVTADGKAKVLDFGLAKIADHVSDLPISTVDDRNTQSGVLLGTSSYMSPEQVRGSAVDTRTDIWAFGCVLFELLTGSVAFKGETLSEVITRINRDEPDWKVLPGRASGPIRNLLRRCLQKDVNRRLQHITDARVEIENILSSADSSHSITKRWTLWGVASVGLILSALMWVAAAWFSGQPKPTDEPPKFADLRATFAQITSDLGLEWFPSLAPDGKSFTYASMRSGNWDVYLQRIGGDNAINLTTGSREDDTQPAFSPDGGSIAFQSNRQGGGIFLMGATGESVRRLTTEGFNPTWSPDGRQIAFAAESVVNNPIGRGVNSELWVVDVATEVKRRVSAGDAVQPSWSPHGDRIAYWAQRAGQRDIWTIAESGGQPLAVTNDVFLDWNPVWSPDGDYLYFASDRGGTMNLWRVRIDEQTGKPLREPESVTTGSSARPMNLSFARDGKRMAYAAATGSSNIMKVAFAPEKSVFAGNPVLVTQGSTQSSSVTLLSCDVSANGEQLVFHRSEPQWDIFVVRTDGSGLQRLTNDVYYDRQPRWSPDGKRITFYSNRSGSYQIWTMAQDGSSMRQVTKSEAVAAFPSWSSDGARIAYTDLTTGSFIVDVDAPWDMQKPIALPSPKRGIFVTRAWSSDDKFLLGEFQIAANRRDGIAVYSMDSKQYEPLSDFGVNPVWTPDGRSVLFNLRDAISTIYVVDVQSKKTRELIPRGATSVGSPCLSPDGRTLFYTLTSQEADLWMISIP